MYKGPQQSMIIVAMKPICGVADGWVSQRAAGGWVSQRAADGWVSQRAADGCEPTDCSGWQRLRQRTGLAIGFR